VLHHDPSKLVVSLTGSLSPPHFFLPPRDVLIVPLFVPLATSIGSSGKFWILLRVPGSPDDYFLRLIYGDPLSSRHHAARCSSNGVGDGKISCVRAGANRVRCCQHFHGTNEAPLVIRPYLSTLTQSELMTIMTKWHGAYFRRSYDPLLHHARSCVRSIVWNNSRRFAGLFCGTSARGVHHGRTGNNSRRKNSFSRKSRAVDDGNSETQIERTHSNVIEAAAAGASTGVQLALNVAACSLRLSH